MNADNPNLEGVAKKPVTIGELIAQVEARIASRDQFMEENHLDESRRKMIEKQDQAELGALKVFPPETVFRDVVTRYSQELSNRLRPEGARMRSGERRA